MSPCTLVSVMVIVWLLCGLAAVFRLSIFFSFEYALDFRLGVCFYASAFRHRRHYVFGLSVHPSKASNNLFSPVHGSIGPSDIPWPFCGMHMSVRPSVRRGFRAFAGERMEGMVWNFACWCILGTFRTDYIIVMVYWFFSFWHHFDLVKWVKFWVSGHFPENLWWEWPEILHADVSWPPSELKSLWSWSVDISNFGIFLLGQIRGFRAFPGEPFE